MKVRFIKCIVGGGGLYGGIIDIVDEIILNEKDFNFEIKRDMCGGGNEDYMYWLIRENSNYFNSNKMVLLEELELDEYDMDNIWDNIKSIN